MDVNELRERRRKLEADIIQAIEAFVRDTGICPQSVDVDMMDVRGFCEEAKRIVSRVEVRLNI